MATSDTIPTQRYDIVHRRGTNMSRVFVIRDAYGRPVDISGLSYSVTIGDLSQMSLDTPVATFTGVFPSDQDAAGGMGKVTIDAQGIDDHFDQVVPRGALSNWKLEITMGDGRTERPFEGEFVYVWW